MKDEAPDLFGQTPSPLPGAGQGMLFDARFFRDTAGMSADTAQRLHAEGFLSFDPNLKQALTEPQVRELDFIWALHRSGCPRPFLDRLLSTLEKPYAYPVARMHLDWVGLRWSVLASPEETIDRWIEEKKKNSDASALYALAASVHGALESLGRNPESDDLP